MRFEDLAIGTKVYWLSAVMVRRLKRDLRSLGKDDFPTRVVVRVERVGNDVLFAVEDSGMGIAAEHLDSIFVRFSQVKKDDRRGLGLGLFISKCIVQGHGGTIWAESNLGRGTTFRFTLPIQS